MRAFLVTMERFNLACDAIAAVAFRERSANKIALQKLVYHDTRQRFRPVGAVDHSRYRQSGGRLQSANRSFSRAFAVVSARCSDGAHHVVEGDGAR